MADFHFSSALHGLNGVAAYNRFIDVMNTQFPELGAWNHTDEGEEVTLFVPPLCEKQIRDQMGVLSTSVFGGRPVFVRSKSERRTRAVA